MRIRTDYIERRVLRLMLCDVNPELCLEVIEGRSRTHKKGYTVGIEFWGEKKKGDGRYRRNRNLGGSGFDEPYAATYDEWGEWIAKLFELDPDAIIGQYRSRDDFHRQTHGHYEIGP